MVMLSSTQELINRAVSKASMDIEDHSGHQGEHCTIRHSTSNEDYINEKWRQTVHESS